MKRFLISLTLFAAAISSGCCAWQNRQPYGYAPAPTYAQPVQACAPVYNTPAACNPGCQ